MQHLRHVCVFLPAPICCLQVLLELHEHPIARLIFEHRKLRTLLGRHVARPSRPAAVCRPATAWGQWQLRWPALQ